MLFIILFLQVLSLPFFAMPRYYWKFQERFSSSADSYVDNYADVCIDIVSDSLQQARNILINHIMKMSRYGIPRIFITPKGDTVVSHSNDARAISLPFINIDYPIFQKILYFQPNTAFELNSQAKPFIPSRC